MKPCGDLQSLCKGLKSGQAVFYYEGKYLKNIDGGLSFKEFHLLHDLFQEGVVMLYQVKDPDRYWFRYYAKKMDYKIGSLSFAKLLDEKTRRKPRKPFRKGEILEMVQQIGGDDVGFIAEQVIIKKGWRLTPSLKKQIKKKVYHSLWNQRRTDRRY